MTGEEVFSFESTRQFHDVFGLNVDPIAEPDRYLDILRSVNPREPKNEGEPYKLRFELENDHTKWPPEIEAAIMACAVDMQMLKESTCPIGRFDIVIVLGGARLSNRDRIQFVIENCAKTMSFNHIIVAGSNRLLKEDERELVRNTLLIDAVTEFDLCANAAQIAAQVHSGLITSQMMVANPKAGTPHILQAVIEEAHKNHLINNNYGAVCAVTNQIYQLSTELDLARMVEKYGFDYGVAGCPSDPEVVAKRTTATYLSEVLRTLRAATLAAQAFV